LQPVLSLAGAPVGEIGQLAHGGCFHAVQQAQDSAVTGGKCGEVDWSRSGTRVAAAEGRVHEEHSLHLIRGAELRWWTFIARISAPIGAWIGAPIAVHPWDPDENAFIAPDPR
jgi:hypothetical protein